MFTVKTSGKIFKDFKTIENYGKLQKMVAVSEEYLAQGKTLSDKQTALYEKAKALIARIEDTGKYKFKGPEQFQNIMREIIKPVDTDITDPTERYFLCPEMKSILSSNTQLIITMQGRLKEKMPVDRIFHLTLSEFDIVTCYDKSQCRLWLFKDEMTDQFNIDFLWDYLLKHPDPSKTEEMISFANARIIGTLLQFLRNLKIKILKYEPTFVLSKFGKLSPIFVATRLKAFPVDTLLNDYRLFFSDIIDDGEIKSLNSFIDSIPEDENIEKFSAKPAEIKVSDGTPGNDNVYLSILGKINDVLKDNSGLPFSSIEPAKLFLGMEKDEATNFYNWMKEQSEKSGVGGLSDKRFASIRNLLRDKLGEYKGPA